MVKHYYWWLKKQREKLFLADQILSLFWTKSTNGIKVRLIDVEYNATVTGSHTFTMNNLAYRGLRNSDTSSNTTDSNNIYTGFENNVMISYDNGLIVKF
jgi:hypothetical protein